MSRPHPIGSLALLGVSLATRAAPGDVAFKETGPSIEMARPPVLSVSSAGVGSSWTSACSFRHPLCVHAPLAVPRAQSLASLAAADRAWDVLTGALALPPPESDLAGVWHAYLVDNVLGGGLGLLEGRDPRAHFDRGTTFGLIDRALPPGCVLDRALARALARASLWVAVPATDEGSARAQAETLARLAAPCEGDEEDRQEFQSHPERTLVDPSSDAFDRGAALFFDWLEATFARDPGGLIRGLWALAPTRTPARASRWSATPTAFDVLSVSFKGARSSGSALDDIFARFAAARARFAPAVHISWHLPWPAQARRLASPEPVSPSGASYVLVDHAGARAGATLRLEAQWEDYGRMRWLVVKLDAAGKVMAELPVTSVDRATRASLTIESLETVDSVLIVGVNVGSTEHPFDPDQWEWEPHGWLLTIESR